ncbi:Uncharacterized protein FWK35_00019098 [Aphis craccivora]|uniref:Uncharacterized protein n=1 Tax=Aphis craccivora TaxID=307492 RepID=A0A6G0Y608_APHCR|nr:Uncharacterized protein FWK35_00019098 [Aphis craccivora]
MENFRNCFDMKLVSCPRKMRKLINRPTIKQCTTYCENLAAVSIHKKEIDFCKPIYIGFAVFEQSKILMYDYHYNVMKRHYDDKITLLYIYTDSLLYRVATDDFYSDLEGKPNLMNRTDTSNLPPDHACHVIRNHLTFDDHKRCLIAVDSDECDDQFDAHMGKLIASSCARHVIECLHEAAATASTTQSTSYPLPPPPPPQPLAQQSYELYTPYRENVSIGSFKHQMKTIKTMKLKH